MDTKSSKKTKLSQQHTEICKDFDQLKICPRGARCQRIHLYPDGGDEPIVKMLDFVIGVLHDHSSKITLIQEQVSNISTHLSQDTAAMSKKAKEMSQTQHRRSSRQMRARSASSDRRQRPSRSSTPIPIRPVMSVETSQYQPVVQPMYNPPGYSGYPISPIYHHGYIQPIAQYPHATSESPSGSSHLEN